MKRLRKETNKVLIGQSEFEAGGELLITSIDTDGTGLGFGLNIAEKLSKNLKIPFIVNGGVSSLDHIDQLLNVSLPSGIAIGSALLWIFG